MGINKIKIFPVSEIILDEQSIDIFRQNYRRSIGTVKTNDEFITQFQTKY